MGKLLDRLNLQLKSEFKQDAEDCIKIYDKLSEITGHVWDSQWSILTDVKFKGFPHDGRTFKPSNIGYVFLNGLEKIQK